MKKSVIVIILLGGLFLSGTLLFTSCNSKKNEQQEQKEAEGHEHKEGEDHDVVYACSMHPEVTGKEGDKCSKCGMKLEAMKKADSTEHHHDH